jgi:hypothetical protein
MAYSIQLHEDMSALPEAFARGMDGYAESFGDVTIAEVLQYFDGSKSALASALAGTTDKSSTAYRTQQRNINRWLAGTRKPSAETLNKFRKQVAGQRPPTSLNVTIRGYIGYDGGDWRWRTIGNLKPIHLAGDSLQRFLDAMAREDTHSAYQAIFEAYGAANLTVAQDANTSITLNFS